MELVKALIPLLLTVSLGGLVMTVGLNASAGDLGYVLKRPALLSRAILAVLIIPPVAAGLFLWFLPIEPAIKAGIMLMAISPVPPLVPGKELKMGGRKAYAYGVYVAMALLTVISVPVVFKVASELFGRDDPMPFLSIVKIVAIGVILPLIVGVVIRRLAPAVAEKAAPIVYKLSMLLVLLAFVPILIKIWPALMHLIGNGTLAAMAVVSAICIAGGHLLGGPDRMDRATLAVASSVRHPGIAMALASANFTDRDVQAAILLFLLVGLVLGAVYGAWLKRSANAPSAAAAP